MAVIKHKQSLINRLVEGQKYTYLKDVIPPKKKKLGSPMQAKLRKPAKKNKPVSWKSSDGPYPFVTR